MSSALSVKNNYDCDKVYESDVPLLKDLNKQESGNIF